VTDLRIVTVEKYAEALEIAKQNLHHHDSLLAPRNNSITLLEGDGLEGLADEGEWDLLVSNPPYVAEGDDALAPGVRRFEPELALFAGADGLDCIRLLLKESVRLLRPEGRLLCELGAGQGEAVRALVAEIPELEFELLHRDLQGHERILQVRRRAGSNDSAGTLRGLQI
jgi:HemK-like putative methylase